jgi:hypothetical protein
MTIDWGLTSLTRQPGKPRLRRSFALPRRGLPRCPARDVSPMHRAIAV